MTTTTQAPKIAIITGSGTSWAAYTPEGKLIDKGWDARERLAWFLRERCGYTVQYEAEQA